MRGRVSRSRARRGRGPTRCRGCRRSARPCHSSAACRAGSGPGGGPARQAHRGGRSCCVAPRVVGHDGLDRPAALFGEPGRCSPQRGRDRLRVPRRAQLAIGQSGVVVDHADHDRLADVRPRSERSPCAQCRAGRTSAARSRRYAAVPLPSTTRNGASSGGAGSVCVSSSRCAQTRPILERRRPQRNCRRIRPSSCACEHRGSLRSVSGSSAPGHEPARAAAAHTRRRSLSASRPPSHRSLAVVTVVGEQPIERAIARAFSPARRRATISRFARGPNLHLPSIVSGLLGRVCRRRQQLPLETGRVHSPSTKCASSSARALLVGEVVAEARRRVCPVVPGDVQRPARRCPPLTASAASNWCTGDRAPLGARAGQPTSTTSWSCDECAVG